MFKFLSKNKFRKEMALVILIKILALIFLWQCCFSHSHEEGKRDYLTHVMDC